MAFIFNTGENNNRKSWKEKREFHKEQAQNVKLKKGEKLTEREKAIRSQGYLAGQYARMDEELFYKDKDKFKKVKRDRKAKKQAYLDKKEEEQRKKEFEKERKKQAKENSKKG